MIVKCVSLSLGQSFVRCSVAVIVRVFIHANRWAVLMLWRAIATNKKLGAPYETKILKRF